jgi:hypothetical protein
VVDVWITGFNLQKHLKILLATPHIFHDFLHDQVLNGFPQIRISTQMLQFQETQNQHDTIELSIYSVFQINSLLNLWRKNLINFLLFLTVVYFSLFQTPFWHLASWTLNYSERGTQRTGNRFYGLLVHHGSPGCEK